MWGWTARGGPLPPEDAGAHALYLLEHLLHVCRQLLKLGLVRDIGLLLLHLRPAKQALLLLLLLAAKRLDSERA